MRELTAVEIDTYRHHGVVVLPQMLDRGTLDAIASARAAVLSPSMAIASGVGPINVIPAAATVRANSAFSERNPYPG